jgi:hypothetical protein
VKDVIKYVKSFAVFFIVGKLFKDLNYVLAYSSVSLDVCEQNVKLAMVEQQHYRPYVVIRCNIIS